MCYEFILYTGCGHDRSILYFRPDSRTKECLCRSFARLPPHEGVCPECDRAIKISRGIPVPPDTLTPQNRANCQAWRAIVDNDVKDEESKRLAREARENGRDESFVTIGRVVHVAARHLKRAESHKKKHQTRPKVGTGPNAVAPPYVPQPGETFLDHILVEVIDDAKCGGELARLQTALEVGLQGYGWIGPNGEESWLFLSNEWMAENGHKMDAMAGPVGAPTGAKGPGCLSPTSFPALPSPAVEIPNLDINAEKQSSNTNTEEKSISTPSKLKFDPTKTFVPSLPLPTITLSPETATSSIASSDPILFGITELPPLGILPLLFEKYEEDGEAVITEEVETGSGLPTTPAAVEEKENVYSSLTTDIMKALPNPNSQSSSQISSQNLSQPPSQPLSRLPSQPPSGGPSSGLPSKTSSPAPNGFILGPEISHPAPRNGSAPIQRSYTPQLPHNPNFPLQRGFTPPMQRGLTPPVPQRGFTPPVSQRGFTPPIQRGFTPPVSNYRNFTPPVAKLRSQFPNPRTYQPKPQRFGPKINGNQHRGGFGVPNPHIITSNQLLASHNPLVPGPRPPEQLVPAGRTCTNVSAPSANENAIGSKQ